MHFGEGKVGVLSRRNTARVWALPSQSHSSGTKHPAGRLGGATFGDAAFSSRPVATRRRHFPSRSKRHAMPPTGLEAVYLHNRDKLVRFLKARGAGDSAEDLVHDLWINVSSRVDEPIANPLAYLYRAADLLMIDRYRSRRQAERRDQAWEDLRQSLATTAPSPDREVSARQEAARAAQVLQALAPRKAAIFRRVRIDGLSQRSAAEEFGVSLSTVESDLREATRALVKLKDDIR